MSPNHAVSFEADIKPLFRERDILAMGFIIDLASYDDIRENSTLVLQRLVDGTMPCDDPWPAERIALMRDWIDGGMAP
jgi:hypothetical protein